MDMKELNENYIDILESLDWSVSGYTGDGRVEIESYSPAGEDLIFCLEIEDFPKSVTQLYLDFDVDEHVEMWVGARANDKDGHMGIPPASTLVHDAEQIEEMLGALADALREVELDNEE